LTDYNPLRLRNNRATTPFAKVIIRLDRLQPPSLGNAYAMTQLKMQQQQHHIIILNQPQKICTSTQNHWKDKSDINNFHVYDKVQLKTEACEKDTRTRNRQSATEQFARRVQLLVVASDDVYSLGGENTRGGELGSTLQATKNTRCGSDDICSLGEVEHSLWRVTTDRSANRPLFSLQNLNFDNPKPQN